MHKYAVIFLKYANAPKLDMKHSGNDRYKAKFFTPRERNQVLAKVGRKYRQHNSQGTML